MSRSHHYPGDHTNDPREVEYEPSMAELDLRDVVDNGATAYTDGAPVSCNPYLTDTPQHMAWRDGWTTEELQSAPILLIGGNAYRIEDGELMATRLMIGRTIDHGEWGAVDRGCDNPHQAARAQIMLSACATTSMLNAYAEDLRMRVKACLATSLARNYLADLHAEVAQHLSAIRKFSELT
mgnify:CR=1 FL=1